MSKIIATISRGKGGKGPTVEFKTEGVPGTDCRVASKPYMDTVAGALIGDKDTAEAHAVSATVANSVNA